MAYNIAFGHAAIHVGDDDEKPKAPRRILLIRDGNPDIKGYPDLKLTAASAQKIIDEYHADGNQLMVDFNHSLTKPANDANMMIAAGWVKNPGGLEYVKGEGLYAIVEWTVEAAQLIEARKFKYVSPLFQYDKESGEIVRVVNFALTNVPRTRRQTELLAASEDIAAMLERLPMKTTKKTPKKKAKTTLRTAKAEDEIPGIELDTEALPEDQVQEIDEVGNAITALAEMVRDKGGELAEDADALTILAAVGDMLAGTKESEGDGESESEGEASKTLSKVAAALNLGDGATSKSIVAAAAKLVVTEGSHADLLKRLKTLESDKTTSRVDAMIETQIEAGVLNPDNERQLAAARTIAESSEEDFLVMCEGLTPLVESGQQFDAKAKTSPKNQRSKLIVAASKEYGENESNAAFLTEQSWVNAELVKGGMSKLTTDETSALVKG